MGKTSALTNLLLLIGPAVLSLLLWASITFVAGVGLLPSVSLAILSSVSGLALLIAAKLPSFRAGRWFSFGPNRLGKRERAMYFGGWSLVMLSVFLCFGLLFLGRQP